MRSSVCWPANRSVGRSTTFVQTGISQQLIVLTFLHSWSQEDYSFLVITDFHQAPATGQSFIFFYGISQHPLDELAQKELLAWL